MPGPQFIFGHCPTCAESYRLPSNTLGRRARCRACDAIFVVQPADDGAQQAASGESSIIRHQKRDRGFELAVGESGTIDAISDHIQRYLGAVRTVFHEIVSDLVHVDVHWVQPSEARPWYTLVTSGMSDRPMNAPPEMRACRHAELMTCLPPDWRLTQEDFKNESWYWPIRWLKILARFPHEYDTWLWEGHTIPNGDPPEPFADNTQFCGVMLLPPITAPPEFATLTVGDKTISFFSMIPLYPDEMDHKIAHGIKSLLPRFEKHGVTDIIDVNRRSVCRRRLGLW